MTATLYDDENYKNDNDEIVVYFASEDAKYKYVYKGNNLQVFCNDSCYTFIKNNEGKGAIKNGDYVFEITTFATKIEVYNNLIVLEYNLSQQGTLIGKYVTELSF